MTIQTYDFYKIAPIAPQYSQSFLIINLEISNKMDYFDSHFLNTYLCENEVYFYIHLRSIERR